MFELICMRMLSVSEVPRKGEALGLLFIYLFIYIDTNNSGLKVPGPY